MISISTTLSGGTGGSIYSMGVARLPDGGISQSFDSVNGAWAYAYDGFDRLWAATSNTGYGCQETYDRYGNRLQQSAFGGGSCASTPTLSPSGNHDNRLAGFTYNGAGAITNDGVHTYAYDAENRVATVGSGGTAAYVYDASGNRVRKISSAGTVDYIYDLAGHVISEMSSSGGWNRGEVYAGGAHIATYDNGTTYYTHSDCLGTERVRTTVAGGVYSTWTSMPFGEGTSTANPSPTHFTGKERDTESGLDYFGARYYASTMGRMMSPDWSAKVMPVPYAKLGDPQSLNLYAYVGNNPLSRTDPTGHYICKGSADQCATIRSALAAIKTAAGKLEQGSDGRNRLEKVLSTYGDEDKKNGVNVAFGDLGGKAEATTKTTSFLGFNKTTTITFDLGKMHSDFSSNGRNEGAENAGITGHEGQHGVDQRASGMPHGLGGYTAHEANAFTTQSYVSQGLGVKSAYGLWDPGWSPDQAEKNRQDSIDANAVRDANEECKNGGCE